jgi:hypothetical protein
MTMSDYDNRNRGVLLTHPDYCGRLNVDGVDLRLSAWLKTSKNGMKYMSLSVKPQNADTAQSKKAAGGGARPQDFNDERPPF